MYDVLPGWYTTIHTIYYISGRLVSILAIVLFIFLVLIKVFKIRKDQYQDLLNIANLALCIISTVLLASYGLELAIAIFNGFIVEQYSFLSRAVGPYWISYILLIWIPLLLTQLLWKKSNRLNVNISLCIVILLNLHMWLERFIIIVTTLMRN